MINPLNPIVHFWLHHTVHSAERVGQGEMDGVTHSVTCTWWLLGLAFKEPWLGLDGSFLALAAWSGLENMTLMVYGV